MEKARRYWKPTREQAYRAAKRLGATWIVPSRGGYAICFGSEHPAREAVS